MNRKSTTYKGSFWARTTALILILTLLLLALPVAPAAAAPFAVPAIDGDGSMTVSPTSAVYGSTGNTFTFTFTPTGGRDFENGSSVRLTIPASWPAPVKLSNVSISQGTCSLNPDWTIVGSTIIIDVWSCLFGQSFTISYYGVTAPGFSGSPYTFLTQTDVPNGGGIFSIATSPTVSITKALLTVSAAGLSPSNKNYDGNTTANLTIGSPTLIGVIGSDDVSLVTTGAAGAFVNANYGLSKTVNISGLTLSGLTAVNYTLTQPTRTADINPATLTYTADAANRDYGSANPAFSGIVTGFVNGENQAGATTGSMSFTSLATATSNAGSYAINGSGLTANNGNYTFVQAVGNATALTVNPATLTYTADAAGRDYGSANPAFSGIVTGFVNGENQAGATTGTMAFTSLATATSNVGSYAINGSGLSANNGNYTFVQAAGNATALTVNPATLTYTADAAGRDYGSANPAFSGIVTGFVNGENQAGATTGSMSFTSLATATSNAGSYAINGSGLTANNGNYTFVQAVGNATALTVNPATLTYTADAAGRDYGSANPTFSGIVTGFVNGENQAGATTGTMAFTSLATATSNVGSYAINGSGLSANNGNYTFVQAAGNATALTINKATPVLSVTNSPVTFSGAPQAATVAAGSVAGVVSNIKYDTSATTPTNAATYAVTADFTPTDSVNYNSLTDASAGNFVINKATPILSVTNSPVTFNGVPQAATITAGSVSGTVSNIKYDNSAVEPTSVGTYAITANFIPTDAANYISLTDASAGNFIITNDIISPNVSSSVRTNINPSSAASVDFTATFSESVTGVDISDFTLTITGSVSGATVSGVSGTGSVYTVAVNTGSGNGTIRLDVVDNNSIVDAASNPLGGPAAGDGNFTTGEEYTVWKSAPPINFTDQLFHTSNPPTVVTIPNTHGTDIHIGTLLGSASVGTTWNTGQSFFIENDTCSGATVIPSGSCTFKVRFLPWSLGAKSGTITVPSDAPDQPYIVSLSGNSIAGTQLLSNRSFDSYSAVTNLPDLWTVSPGIKVGIDTVDSSWAFNGPLSFKFVGDGDLKILSQTINKAGVAGDDFSFNVMTKGVGIPVNAQRWLLQVMFLNNGVTVENRNIPLTTGTFSNVRLTRMYTAVSSYNQILFRIHYGKSSGTAWVDLANLQWAP